MSKKDYKLFVELVISIINILRGDNKRFDVNKFIVAVLKGVESNECSK